MMESVWKALVWPSITRARISALAVSLFLPFLAHAGQVAYDYTGQSYDSVWTINGTFVLDEADLVPGVNLVSQIQGFEFTWTNGTDTYTTSSAISTLGPDGVGEFYFYIDDQLNVERIALENDAGFTRHPLFGFEADGLVWNASFGDFLCCKQGPGSFSAPRDYEAPREKPRYFKTLDLSSVVNSDLSQTAFRDLFKGPGIVKFGGIPFNLANGGNGNAWAIEGLQVSPDGEFLNPPAVYTVSGLDIRGASKMYAVINSAFGICGVPVGSIGVTGAEFELIEGKNIRDWLNGPWCNDQTDAVYTADFAFPGIEGIPPGPARFDVYEFDLSSVRGSIREFSFENYGEFFILGAPFLLGVTFEMETVSGIVHSAHVGGPDACAQFDLRPGCDANLSLSATEFANGKVSGSWTDRFGSGSGFTASVDCLAVEGNQAWVSGHVIASNSDRYPIGQPILTTVIDNSASPLPDQVSRSYRTDVSCQAKPRGLAEWIMPQGKVSVR